MTECATSHCTTAVGRYNKSGFCRQCTGQRLADERMAKMRHCSCGKKLSHGCRHDKCRKCMNAEIDARVRHCKSCGKQIDARAVSNFCYEHSRRKAGAPVAKPGIRPIAPYKMAELFTAASMITRIPVDMLKGKSKNKPCVNVRFAIWHLSKGYFSYPAMGRMSGGRDHATVINGCKKAAAKIEADKPFRLLVEAIHNEALRTKENERRKVAELITRIAA